MEISPEIANAYIKFKVFAIVGRSKFDLNVRDKSMPIRGWASYQAEAERAIKDAAYANCAIVEFEFTTMDIVGMLNKELKNAAE